MADLPTGERMATDAVVNLRTSQLPILELDGQPFPFYIDKAHGVQVIAKDDNVHLVIVAIQVDRSVTVIDHTPQAS